MELKIIHTIVLSVFLSRVSNVQGQCERPHFTGNQVLISDADNFPEGSQTRIQCATGYITVSQSSSRYVTCKNGEWTEPELQCKKKPCGNPGEIQHGRYLIPEKDGILFGAVITAECNKGYRLASRFKTRNCLANGWDGRPPICEAVQCERPNSLPHLTFEPMQDSYQFGEAIKYSCLNSLILIGERISSCTADGIFQPAPPECRSVSCNRPFIPHAFRSGGKSPPYEYKNFVQYECDRGYKMKGSNYLICEENGWNPEPPECNIVTCPKLPLIEHGRYEPDKPIYEYNNKIKYFCDYCYRLLGPTVKTCSENEDFTPTYPATMCTRVYCDRPRGFNNGNFQPNKPRYDCGDSINITCNVGFELIGSKESKCSDNGRITIPTCKMWTCLRPPINNGEVKPTKSRYNYNESLEFLCKPGFKLNGHTSIKCLENEKYDHPPPTCEAVTCPPPHDLINGEFQPIRGIYAYDEKVKFYCNPGYELKGIAERYCSQDGIITSPSCIKLNCPQPNIKNADVFLEETDGDSFSRPVLYTCKKGFKRDGPGYLNCTSNGWKPNPDEQCKEITCEAPGIINGKKLGGPIYKFDTSVEYECDEGYKMNGSNKMSCKQQGWKGRPPQCNKPSSFTSTPDLPQLLKRGRPARRPSPPPEFRKKAE